MLKAQLIQEYLAGPALVRDAIAGLMPEQLRSRPAPGHWSTLEVICHLADVEIYYAEQMKRIATEEEPVLVAVTPAAWLLRPDCQRRNIEIELRLIDLIRCHTAYILHPLKPEDFQRRGIDATDGVLTLETLLRRATAHIPHHTRFIHEKRCALFQAAW
ncbi:MAG TPA: DinB family protein [Gemmataceae bacterium]|jgi:hypothetical protein|nr:DinB family protein [Gemmataceae bacterium]